MSHHPGSQDPAPFPAQRLPRVAVTMGDPAGVGPELCLRLLATPPDELGAVPLVIGSGTILARVSSAVGLHVSHKQTIPANQSPLPTTNAAALLDLDTDPALKAAALSVEPGQVSAAGGRLTAAAVELATSLATAGHVNAVCTGPANKQSMLAAGVPFPGHTEWFAARTHARIWCMCFHTDELIVSLATIHVGYSEVPGLLTVGGITDVIALTGRFARDLLGREPRLAVLGLNPHAGEGGRFGCGEEQSVIEPAILRTRAEGWQVAGPLPPDTAFIPDRRAATDAYVCMYHDQGLIPLKMLAFDRAVNLTLGLPIIRTSVDHGTAFDIAWQGRANAGSLLAAVRLAGRMARQRAGV